MSQIEENLSQVRARIFKVCEKVKRDPQEIKIVAVTKNVAVEKIKQAIACGIEIIGENKVQEAQAKYNQVDKKVLWHLVGHLQTNKVKKALEIFDLIQSIDSLKLAVEINGCAKEKNKILPILIEVNTSGEETKYGVKPEQTENLIREMKGLENLKIKGLMTIGPLTDDKEKIRESFRETRGIYEKLESVKVPNLELEFLSMGMSSDFEIALEEGSNMLRIGTAIFGPRS
ncbi:MAG: YggS family pyridoxal phosphate enzyme [candidate division Zixibacteria bacterium RBG_16_40_9]|nr:MAG: YggS family pyridoxal phosphate enzyme [candidate division Zixibacteria bacterium RBG_16_40_9]